MQRVHYHDYMKGNGIITAGAGGHRLSRTPPPPTAIMHHAPAAVSLPCPALPPAPQLLHTVSPPFLPTWMWQMLCCPPTSAPCCSSLASSSNWIRFPREYPSVCPVHVCMRLMCARVCVCVCACVCVRACVRVCACVRACLCLPATHACLCVCVCAHVCMCVGGSPNETPKGRRGGRWGGPCLIII